jgi:hypothetical protein
METYCSGSGSEWYTGCPERDRLTKLADENGIDTLDVHDAPELTAQAVWGVLRDGPDREWLAAEFGPFASAE